MSGPPQTNNRWVPSAHALLGVASEGAALPQMGLARAACLRYRSSQRAATRPP